MKTFLKILFGGVLFFTLISCDSSSSNKNSAAKLVPNQVLEMSQKNEALIFDLREERELSEVIEQAQWMPMSKLESGSEWSKFTSGLPKDKTIIFYCASGYRSKRIAEKLAAEGYKAAYFEGPSQWKAAGLPLKKRQ